MSKQEAELEQDDAKRRPHVVRLPGFMGENGEFGLGDVVKRFTTFIGVKPCGGCESRAAAMNRWAVFTSRRSR